MNVNKKEIKNLAINIFDDAEYSRFIKLFKARKYNNMRLMVDEKISYIEVESSMSNYTTIAEAQLLYADKLEDHIMELIVNYYVSQ